ncbi:flagellin [Clostridium luticellarii]|uniref:Flagellin n=1 Tax=Clostridium luticellarii TaxID=1691940 RepID=A0A2T0BMY5_9CLOT|nr:flagellin [Clostridium luticellarii]PRR85248.1 Flagellin [Clostridium luticellarii]
MIINHNLMANNALRNMGINSNSAAKAMEKLSSGLRINRAGDDAAGLAISEKMRGQINGLNQASSNSQDAISMIQTAEGALNETHSILQRMRTLATQAANDTNVEVDRGEIQKEINQLSSEINRIGNTTEFNTQALLKGDGTQNLDKTGVVTDVVFGGGATNNTQATQLVTIAAAATAGSSLTVTLNGEQINLTYAANATAANDGKIVDGTNTGNAAQIYIDSTSAAAADDADAIASALNAVIQQNSTLKGGYTATATSGVVTIKATAGGQFAGAAGNIAASTASSTTFVSAAAAASVGTTTYTAATADETLVLADTAAVANLVGKGMMIGDHEIEFYDASKGAYTGNAIGVDISGAGNGTDVAGKIVAQLGTKFDDVTITNADNVLTFTSKLQGEAGNTAKISDGGIQQEFKATFQVGANQGQQLNIDINDMRSIALDITGKAGSSDAASGAAYTSTNTVTNGTDAITREASLDVSTATNATNAIKTINNAIEKVSSERSKLGAFQNRLEHTINNLGVSSENLTSAESRIRDVDMAAEMSEYSKNNILSQAAQAMLAQANTQPQQVLQLLR